MPRTPSLACACALSIVATLAACTTPQERAARAQAEVEQMMAVYGPACGRLGYTAGSDPWRRCVLDLGFKDDVQRAATQGPYGPGGPWGPGAYWGGRWGRYW